MLFVCLLFYRCKYRFIWRFEVVRGCRCVKVFVLLSNALKSHLRRSNGKRKWLWAVLQTISSAQKLHAQRFKSACRAIAKKRTPPFRRWYGFWRVSIFVVNRHLLQILRCWLLIANCCRRRYFLFYLSDYKHSPIVFFWVCGCGCNQSDEKVQPIKKSTIVIKLTVYKQPNCHLSDIQSMCGD